jgi:NAD(P)-dependent dehydrogenase (short-subunit alcohol dehydrogenase family)
MSFRTDPRPIAVITGACGGMGRACARLLGRRYRLALTDVREPQLASEIEALEQEGYAIAAGLAGDLADPSVTGALAELVRAAGKFGALVHTAGLSPALAGWEAILRANLVATEHLLAAFEPQLTSETVAVLIASMAGHMAPAEPAVDAILEHPLADDLLQRIQPHLQAFSRDGDAYGLSSPAYSFSKRAVIHMVERRAAAWGARGARIVSISPGTIWTPMGRKEAESNPGAAAVVEATPAGRWGTAMDIANAADFLVSDLAGFISGCDLRVDGGVTPAMGGRF